MHSLSNAGQYSQRRAYEFQGREIITTGNRIGSVIEATVSGGVVRLLCQDEEGFSFITSNEFATIRD